MLDEITKKSKLYCTCVRSFLYKGMTIEEGIAGQGKLLMEWGARAVEEGQDGTE